MKKRLRKKLLLGEFKETGFEITWKFNPGTEETECNQFLDAMVPALQGKNLVFWGGCCLDDASDGIIVRASRYSCTDSSDKDYISDWFRSRKEILEFTIGEDVNL
jgi:uncharacterized protein YggL (DUF469 family)